MSLADDLAAAGIPYTYRKAIPVTSLHPNPWNPNRMSKAVLEAARESIEAFGFIDPVTCRVHPHHAGHFQLIDGEHRWKVAKEGGIKRVPGNVLDVDDATAKKLTIVLNETRGEADPVLLAELLGDLRERMGDEAVVGMPYTPNDLDALTALASEDWDGYRQGTHAIRDAEEPTHFTIRARLPESFRPTWDAVRARVEEGNDLDSNDRKAAGQIIAACLLDWTRHGDDQG